jgi:hypothetical protein
LDFRFRWAINAGVEEPLPRKRRVRVRVRNRRTVRLVLFCLGATGITLGAVLLAASIWTGNSKLLWLGIVYLLASLALLALRQAMILAAQVKRRRAYRASGSEAGVS